MTKIRQQTLPFPTVAVPTSKEVLASRKRNLIKRLANPTKNQLEKHEYYERNKEKIKIRVKLWKKTHRQHAAKLRSASFRRFYAKQLGGEKGYKILRYYGLSWEDYSGMWQNQNGHCAVCQRLADLDIDHNAITKEVRGLLCSNCNTALGQVHEDPKRLHALIAYISQFLPL